MSYDMDMCTGRNDGAIAMCPLRERCKRYILGQKAMREFRYSIWWVMPAYKNGKCYLFVENKEGTT